ADADAGGGDAGAADAGAGEVPVDEGADSESRLDLTTFSLGFVSLENRRNTADVSFPFLDQLDLEDGDVDSDPASVKSRRLDLGQATPRTGTTTYIVQKAQSGSISRTAAIVFQGLSQTSVSFQERRAAFSRSKIQRVGQDEQSLPAVRDPWSIYTSFKEALFQPQLTRRESSATILSTSGIKEWDIYEPLHEIRAKQPEDTLAFREYTTSFRTLDLRSNATLFQVIPRTAILKEKIEGVGGGQNFKIMLWVDQVFLPGSDSFPVPQTETVGLETPPDSQVQLDPETQVLTSLESQLQNQSVLDQVVRIPARVGKLLTVQNPFDVPLKILFFLTNGGSASQKFQISEGVATSTGKIIPIPLLPAKVFTRDSVMRAVERIDQENFVNPKGSKAFLILNKTDDDDDLILKLSRSTAVVAAAPFTVSGGGGGGCFIATASFGSMEHPAVKSFCRFRDEFLLKSALGREFVSFYYRNSPAVAQVLRSHPLLRTMVVIALTPVWWLLEGMWLKLILQFLLLILLLMATLQIYKSTNSQPS
ncbi:hypothetical protein HOF92_11225, partial [bacterium]|nr:hypothetical protein [bacterium]